MPKANIVALDQKRKREISPRTPSRGRGLVRYEALLDATERLLERQDPDEVGLYQIAEEANIPPPSVYHFFPTKEAAFEALARRVTTRLFEIHRQPIDARLIGNWTDLFRIDIDRARDFYNRSKPALKIFYGGYSGIDAQSVDRISADQISATGYDRMNALFFMPHMPDAPKALGIRLGILDAIWTISTSAHGYITDEYHDEAYRACHAYSRLYLPDRLERRPFLIDAARRGQQLLLPFDGEVEIMEGQS